MITDAFVEVGKEVANALGSPDTKMTVIPHPLGGLKAAQVEARAKKAFQEIMRGFATRKELIPEIAEERTIPREVLIDGDWEEVNDYCYTQGWTDGLPIVPPTPERVERMLGIVGKPSESVVGSIPPMMGKATVEKVAVNAVMAGCLPAYLPVVLASVEAICDPQFNLLPMQATTNPVTPMIVVNGPIAKQLQLNSDYNVMGQGWRSNATIGRSLRFVLNNIGGGIPGKIDKATHGQPGKFSFCIAENQQESPWEPFHVEKGFSVNDSTVSVLGVTGTQDIIHYARTTAKQILATIVHSIPREGHKNLYSGGQPLLIIAPEQAAILAAGGYSKKKIKQVVFQKTRTPVSSCDPAAVELIRGRRPRWFSGDERGTEIPIAEQAEDIQIIVAGGAGNHTVFVPTWGDTRCVTIKIRE